MEDNNKAVYPAEREEDYSDSYEYNQSKPAQYKTESGRKKQPRPQKKKAGCCFKTCLSGMILALIILVGGIGVGWYFGDAFMKQQFDVPLKDAFRVVGNLKDYRKARKNLKEGFKESDADGFVDSLGEAILLKPGSLTADEIKDILVDLTVDSFNDESQNDSENGADAKSALTVNSFNDDNDDASDITDNDYVNMLLDLYSGDKFNKAKIAAYEDSKIEDYYVTVYGSELAAFLNDIFLKALFESEVVKGELDKRLSKSADFIDLNEFDFKDVLQIKQIVFYKNSDNVTGVTLTTQTNFKKLINSARKSMRADDLGLPVSGFLESLANAGIGFGGWFTTQFILPKELYVTVDMPLSHAAPAKIKLNNTDQKDWGTLKKILSELEDSDTNFVDSFDKMFLPDGDIGKAVTNINKQIPFADMIDNQSGKGGVIKCDLIGLALEFLNVNYYDELQYDINGDPILDGNGEQLKINKRYADEDCLTSKDIYSSLKYLIAADTDDAMKQHGRPQKDPTRYTFKTDANGKYIFEYGLPVLDTDGFDAAREGALIGDALDNKLNEYEQMFIDVLAISYGLKADVTFDSLFDMLMSGDNTDLSSIFDSGIMGDKLKGDAADTGAIITDKMLAAIVAKRMDKFMGGKDEENGEEGENKLEGIIPRYVVLTKEEIDGQFHNLAEIGIEIDLLKLLESSGEAGALGAVFSAILPESILVCVKIDITLNQTDDFYLPVQLSVDRLTFGDEGMARILKVFNRLNVFGGQSMDEYMSQMLEPVRDIIKTMEENMLGLSLEESQINLPDPLELVTSMLNKSMNADITRDELKENMEFILNKTAVPEFAKDDNLNEYLAWAYAMTSERGVAEIFDIFAAGSDDADGVLEIVDIDKLVEMSDVSQNNPSYYSEKITDFGLDAYVDVNSYDAKINAERLAKLLLDYAEENDSVKDYLNEDTLKFVRVYKENNKEYIELLLELESSTLMDKGGSSDSNTTFLASIIGKMYMTVLIDITPDTLDTPKAERQSSVILNGDKSKTDTLIDFIKKLGIDLESVKTDVLNMLEENVVSMFDKVNDSGIIELKMSQDGDALILTNVFDTMTNVMVQNKPEEEKAASKISGTQMQSVIYGMYKPQTDASVRFMENNPILIQSSGVQGLIDNKDLTLQSLLADGVGFADYELGGLIVEGTASIGTLLSFNIISKGDNEPKAEREKDWLDGFDTDIDWQSNNYLSLIFEIDLRGENSFLGSGGGSLAQKVLPQTVYGTILIKEKNAQELAQTPDNRYELIWFRINEMDKATQSCLYKLADKTEESVQNTTGEYFATSSGQINTVLSDLEAKIQEEITALSALLTIKESGFAPALPLPVGNTSVGYYLIRVEIETIGG